MSNHCQHCGRILDGKNNCKKHVIEVLPIDINSVDFGESAMLCEKCFWFVQHSSLTNN